MSHIEKIGSLGDNRRRAQHHESRQSKERKHMNREPVAVATISVAFLRSDHGLFIDQLIGVKVDSSQPQALCERDQQQMTEILASLLEALAPFLQS